MRGSSIPVGASLPPLRLAARLLISAVLVLYVLHVLGSSVLDPLVPVFRSVIGAVDRQFVITEAFIGHEGAGEVLLFRANLKGPVIIGGGKVMYPFGSHGVPAGGFQVSYRVNGVLLYSALLLIIVIVWPVRGALELAVRPLLGFLAVTVLLLIDVPSTVVAELHHGIETGVDRHALGGWMIWSRFLMGGGGMALSILLAVLVIRAARRCAPSVPGLLAGEPPRSQ